MSEPAANNDRTGSEIAVIGMAGRFPGARNIQQFWENLKNGVESVSFFSDEELDRLDIEPQIRQDPNFVNAKGGVLEDKDLFDASFFGYTPLEAEIMDPQVRIFHECVWESLEDAGYHPGTFNGAIGLFAGASSSSYWEALTYLTGKSDILGPIASGYLNDKDFLCTRVAYKLNLKGPAVLVKTACSTSLVAIHMACQAILNGECEMALAGGISVIAREHKGYLYQEGMIMSQDGHTRAFDAKARGTVGGNGGGVVLLKSLEDALDDRDHIYAVVKGTAINNDGTRRIGFTAPSIEGQAEVIRVAHQVAEVEPESIGYVEAHGTGTILGDPVEIEGLKLAFDTTRRGYCPIGSLKTNLGHLDAAAGVAGFIKVVLALKSKLIPPSLNFETPNPKIDFQGSPFYVNTELTEWKSNSYPRRAGISSFGIGGTNAHAVLEEWEMENSCAESRPFQLILLSAKTQSGLDNKSRELANHFEQNPGTNLADAAYTLKVGRAEFPCRRMAVCPDIQSAIDSFSPGSAGKTRSFYYKEEIPSVVFMFSGLGAQYAGMGAELYQSEPVFREEMDRCFDIIHTLVDYNIKEILFPPTTAGSPAGNNPSALDRFEVAQLAVFAIEYALAKLLIHWGIRPNAVIGYSFGEYTAACIAGIFSLEDVLKLITARGQLIGELPGGSMLSVPLPLNQLTPLLPNDLSVAIDNGPSCIVSGKNEAVNAFEKQLKEKRIMCMKVPNSHALHSREMEPVSGKYREHFQNLQLNNPAIPVISNVTGNYISAGEAVESSYWARHLRETVRFADGIEELKKLPNPVFVEIGPGRDLKTLLVRHNEDNQEENIKAVNLIRPRQQKTGDQRYLLSQLGQLWMYGVDIRWEQFYSGQERYRVPLPTYPFEGQSFKLEGDPFKQVNGGIGDDNILKEHTDIADWFYLPSWKRSVWTRTGKWEDAPSKWLVFIDECGLGTKITAGLLEKGKEVTVVRAGTDFEKTGPGEFTVNPANENDYDELFNHLKKDGNIPGEIIHMWGVTGGGEDTWSIDSIDKVQDLGYYSLLNTTLALGKLEIPHEIPVMVVTDNMQEVTGTGESNLCPLKSTVLGAVRGIPLEYNTLKLRSIDIILPESSGPGEEKLIQCLFNEFLTSSANPITAIRDNRRWVSGYDPLPLETTSDNGLPLKEDGVYLVTGGLGGIGFILARHLAGKVSPRLVLTGRSSLPAREEWENHLSTHDQDDSVSIRIRKIRELESMGAQVAVFSADTADMDRMRDVVRQVSDRFGPINGIIHAAGIADGALIPLRKRADSEKIFSPKVRGTLVLDTIFKDKPLDFFVLCSSLDAITTSPGQVGYCAANNFQDAFARFRSLRGDRKTMSINWDRWEGVGIAVIAEKLGRDLTGDNLPAGISSSDGEYVFDRLLEEELPQVVVSKYDLEAKIKQADRREVSSLLEIFGDTSTAQKLNKRPDLDTPYVAPGNPIEEKLVDIWTGFFGFQPVGIQDDFFEMGGDSLKALILLPKILKELSVEVPVAEFFNHPTIRELAGYIADHGVKKTYNAIEPAEIKEHYPLSSAQQRIYIVQQMDSNSTSYNEPMVYWIEGNLVREKFDDIFMQIIRRHESLRTAFQVVDGEPVQKIFPEIDFRIPYHEVNGEAEAVNFLDDFVKPFNLSEAPIMRAALIKFEEDRHLLIIDMHHIISDGTSVAIIMREFVALYGGRELPQLRVQYKDYLQWTRGEAYLAGIKRQQDFWLKEFAGELPVLDLPTDNPRPRTQDFRGSKVEFDIDESHTLRLRELASQKDATCFMILLAIFNILLSKLTGNQDIIVGTSVEGRMHEDLRDIIGMFVNTLPLRNYPTGEKTFSEFLADLKTRTLATFDNQDYPFDALVNQLKINRDVNRNPLFDVLFQLDTVDTFKIPGIENLDLHIKPYQYRIEVARFDLRGRAFELESHLHFRWEYSTALFNNQTVERFVRYFKEITSSVIHNPDTKLKEISLSHDLHEVKSDYKEEDYSDFNF